MGVPLVITGDPAHTRQVFSAQPETFAAYFETIGPLLGPKSLIVASGQRHRDTRKLLSPPFHGARMRTYGETIAAITRRHAARWIEGQTFAMLDTTMAISLDVIIETMFGIRGDDQVRAFRRALRTLVKSFKAYWVVFPALRRHLGGFGPWDRFVAARRQVEQMLLAQIASRRAAPDDRADILGMLLALRYDDGSPLPDDELIDNLFNLLIAGHETTGATLAWTFFHLGQHPSAFARLDAELDAAGDDVDTLERLPFLEAVCHETLRLCPVTLLVARRLVRPLELGSHTLPPGTGVGVAPALLHAREDTFPRPHEFIPERFLGKTYSAFEYVPFGGGSRRCIGAAFSLFEMKIVLATLLREHRLRLLERRVRLVSRNVSLAPSRGIRMTLDARRLGERAAPAGPATTTHP